MNKEIRTRKLLKTFTNHIFLFFIFIITFAGSGGGSNGGKGGGGSNGDGKPGSGGGKGSGCNFSSLKPLRVNLGAFQYLPATVAASPAILCGRTSPEPDATPHRFLSSLTPYYPTLLASQPNSYLCQVSVVSTCGGLQSGGDQIDFPWNSSQNYLDIQIYEQIPCVIYLRYWDRMNLFPCPGNTTNLRTVWSATYDNGGAIINDAEITVTPQAIAFSN